MNLRLRVSRLDDRRDYSRGRHIRFSVVDLDKSKEYPANYVCMLPLNPRPRADGKAHSTFSKLFGSDSLELAKRFLTRALQTENDLEIRVEIERRLALLAPKPAVQVKCRVCGTFFEPRWRRQKMCQECTRKKYQAKNDAKPTSIF